MRSVLGLLLLATLSHAQLLVRNSAEPIFDVNGRAVIAPGTLIGVAPDVRTLVLSPIDATRNPSIKIQSGNTELDAQVLQISRNSVLAVVPSTLPLGAGRLSFSYTGTRGDVHTAEAAVSIVGSNFELFYDSAQNGMQDGPSPNRPENPARPGQFVTLWGTGLGNARPGDVSVLLGGKAIVPSFVGHASALPGVNQINFQIPLDPEIPDDCSVAVAVKVGAEVSKIRTLSKTTDGEPCYYLPRFGLSGSQRAKLDAGRLPFGYVEVTNSRGALAFFSVSAEFGTLDAAAFASQFAPVFANGFEPDCVDTSMPRPRLSTRENVGDSITLTTPGYNISLGHSVDPAYSNEYSFYSGSEQPIVAGQWQFSSPGNSRVSAFSTVLNMPRAIEVNFDELKSVDRSTDLNIRWDPGGYSERDAVTASLSQVPAYTRPGYRVQCSAPATQARLTLPQSLLAHLPPPTTPSFLTARLTTSSRFSIPRNDGSEFLIFFTYHSQSSRTSTVR